MHALDAEHHESTTELECELWTEFHSRFTVHISPLTINMARHAVKIDSETTPVHVQTGTLLTEALHEAEIDISQPCGGQGRCGRCAVQVTDGTVRQRSTLRLSQEDLAQGYVLACQAVVEGDVYIHVPPQETLERRLTTDLTVAEVAVPSGYKAATDQPVRRVALTLAPPSLDDQTDDWSRLQTTLRKETGISELQISLPLLRKIGAVLRQEAWQVTAVLDSLGNCPSCPARLIDVLPGHLSSDTPLWGAAIDIGTTTVSVWLVDLAFWPGESSKSPSTTAKSGAVKTSSRALSTPARTTATSEMQDLVLATINDLIKRACQREKADQQRDRARNYQRQQHYDAPAAGDSSRRASAGRHLSRQLTTSPFSMRARIAGLDIHPEATVDCLPGVASYVGADISAGVLSSGMDDSEKVSLFMDIGTNGETALGSHDWLVTCACSAGPAFEGAGVQHGMRATRGAIEEVWINGETFEPTYRVIGDAPAAWFLRQRPHFPLGRNVPHGHRG